jgi:hypothetical protein
VIFDHGAAPQVAASAQADTPLAKAAELLAHDLKALTGQDVPTVQTAQGGRGGTVMIGLADSPEMAGLLKANGIDPAPIAGKWETYGRVAVPAPWDKSQQVLLIFGSDVRGTVWGVMDLSRELGVSPWEWWADVAPRKVARLAVSGDLTFSKEPTVKYRGIFLNAGRNGLEPWAGRVYDPGHAGLTPKSYGRIYELMWRLKANAIWPYMGEFNEDPKNYDMAASYAIVRGSSHVEMLLRTNGPEWGTKRGDYNWFTNRSGMVDYWTEAIRKYGKYDNLYTVGLRAKDDFPMEGVKTPTEVAEALTQVIAAQREILQENIGKPADRIPQALTLYKEVLPAFMTGKLKLPDDVTMIWPEDDFGYIRQLSNEQQRQRSGGSGVYYHATFWGPPMSYLWIAATDPSLMWEEMTKAVRFDARQVWILNVGSIKPVEFLTQFFLELGFNSDAYPDGRSVKAYLHRWIGENFGPEHADEITDMMWQYYKLAFDRNPEYMSWTEVFPETPVKQTEFNMLSFGDENARRAEAYRHLRDRAAVMMAALPADRKDAFYELVRYPVDIATDLNLRQLDLDKTIAYGLQHRASANHYAEEARGAHEAALADSRYFNTEIAGGKWQGWMTTAHNDLPMNEAPHIPTWSSAGPLRWGIQTEGGEYIDSNSWWMANLPLFHPELPNRRYIDIFVSAPVDATWTARPSVPWIKVDRAGGSFSVAKKHFEDRIWISIDWSKAPKGESLAQLGVLQHPLGSTGDVIIACSAGKQIYNVHLLVAPDNAVHEASFIEADGIVSMYAMHPNDRSGEWKTLDGLAHVGVGATMQTSLDLKSVDAADQNAIKSAPSLTYRFATTTYDDQATLSVFALPTYPITSENGVRVGVTIDDGPMQILDFNAPEYSQAWRQHVLTNLAVQRVGNLRLKPGGHILRVWGLDPGVILERFEVSFTGAAHAYGAVPETRIQR